MITSTYYKCCDWSIKQAGESKPAFIARLSIELLPISPINLTGFFFHLKMCLKLDYKYINVFKLTLFALHVFHRYDIL